MKQLTTQFCKETIGETKKTRPRHWPFPFTSTIRNENKNFLGKKEGSSKFSFAFIYNSETYGVWVDYNLGLVFVSLDYIKNTPFLFACTLNDHSPNTLLLSSVKSYNCWKVFINAFRQGNIRFENMKIKNVCNDLIAHIIKWHPIAECLMALMLNVLRSFNDYVLHNSHIYILCFIGLRKIT